MKMVKTMALVAMGAGAVLAYQKYSDQIMKKLGTMAEDMLEKADQKLEDMM